jgi:dTDP-4-amino-4,6-dideoxygalactose transaminase
MFMRIPSSKHSFAGREITYLEEVIASGNISSDGRFTRACARLLEEQYSIRKVLMTPSGTAALEMAAMLCDLGPGDEAILPSFTFASTANAILKLGAKPIFVDIRPDTLNLDETLIENAITPRTKAIFPVHYAGVGCEMDPLLEIAQKYQLQVVEDAAQAVNGSYKGLQLPLNKELRLRRRRSSMHQFTGTGGPRRNHPREGHQSQQVPTWGD